MGHLYMGAEYPRYPQIWGQENLLMTGGSFFTATLLQLNSIR